MVVAGVRNSGVGEWTESDTFYFAIFSLVYPFYNGHLDLCFPDFNVHNVGRFSPTIESLTDISLVPKSVLEEVSKTVLEFQQELSSNQLKMLERLIDNLKHYPSFTHYYEDEFITFWEYSAIGKQIRGDNYYLETFYQGKNQPPSAVLYYRDILWQVYYFSYYKSEWIYSQDETEKMLNGESEAHKVSNDFARKFIFNKDAKPFVSPYRYTYEIIYELNGGEIDKSNKILYRKEDTPITLNNPTKYGYRFDGWYQSADFSGQPVTRVPEGAYGDKKFYAKWITNQYKIIFDVDGGSPLEPIVFVYDTVPNLPTPTKRGFRFDGWYTDSEREQKVSFPTKSEENDKVKVGFNPDAFALTLSLSFPTMLARDTTIFAKWIPTP